MTGPPAIAPVSTVPAQIRAQQTAAPKFCSDLVEVRDENGRRIGAISQAKARQFLSLGGYEAVGSNTVKYLRRVPASEGSVDGPIRKAPPLAQGNFTIATTGNLHEHIESKRKGL